MNLMQKIAKRLIPGIEESTRRWNVRCTGCGKERSVWDGGGIIWRKASYASVSPLLRCSDCNGLRRATFYKIEP